MEDFFHLEPAHRMHLVAVCHPQGSDLALAPIVFEKHFRRHRLAMPRRRRLADDQETGRTGDW